MVLFDEQESVLIGVRDLEHIDDAFVEFAVVDLPIAVLIDCGEWGSPGS